MKVRACDLDRAAAGRHFGDGGLAMLGVGSTPSPWLAVHASAVRSMTQLAGLSPKARTPKQLASKRGPPPSYYDQMRMERER